MNSTASWRKIVAKYSHPDSTRAWWQVINSYVPYIGLWVLMYLSLSVSYWLTIGLSVVAAGFLIRIFIIAHDCGHGSFLKNKKVQDAIGFVSATLAFTPYYYWAHCHAIHHATAGNLDKRGVGDVWTLTLQEYNEMSRWDKLKYRLYRNPFVTFVLGPIYMFIIRHRIAAPGAERRWHISVFWANMGLLAVAAFITLIISLSAGISIISGLKAYLLIQAPTIVIAGVMGVWLFYVQHQFDEVYWDKQEKWDYLKACLQGSTFYKLPRVLQFFSGNIGFHHIHHLNPRIPNYLLEKCHRENPLFHSAMTLGFLESFRTAGLRVYDEEQHRMVGLGPFFL